MAIKESYMNDFSSGLVSKKLYSRTDLELFRKGLPDIKGAIPNVFGNMDNFDFDFNQLSDLLLDDVIIEKIKKNDFVFAARENESQVVENYIYVLGSPQRDYIPLFEINLNRMSSHSYNVNIISNPKILCYVSTIDSLIITGNITYVVDIKKMKTSTGTFYQGKNFGQDFIKYYPPSSELKRLSEYQLSTGEILDHVQYAYDSRNNFITLSFWKGTDINNVTEVDGNLIHDIEIEIAFGKFQRKTSATKGMWDVLKQPIRDTLVVESNGAVIPTVKWNYPKDIFYREVYKSDFFNNLDDAFVYANRLCVVKNNKLFMSKIGNYDNFSNVENGDSECVMIELPFEKYITKGLFDDLILFSNRGIYNTSGFISPTNSVLKYISSVVSTKDINVLFLYNGINFVNKDKDEVYNISFNGETQVYNCNKLSSTIEFKNINNLDMIISNETTSESLLVTDDNRTYLFNFNVTEQIKFWTSLDKKEFLFSFFEPDGNLNYLSLSKVEDFVVIKNSIFYKHSNFMFKLFKPDTNKGQFKPNFFDKNIIVNQVEIMYTGNGKISVHNNSKATSDVIVDKRIFTNTQFDITFDSEVKIAKSRTNFMYGDDVSFFVETDDKFSIYAVNLYME